VRPGGGDGFARARQHFDRAVALSAGQLASPYVGLAENVAVPTENLEEFKSLLERALAVDPDARPEWRLENTIMRERAGWLMSRVEKLFLVEPEDEGEETEPEPQPPEEIQP